MRYCISNIQNHLGHSVTMKDEGILQQLYLRTQNHLGHSVTMKDGGILYSNSASGHFHGLHADSSDGTLQAGSSCGLSSCFEIMRIRSLSFAEFSTITRKEVSLSPQPLLFHCVASSSTSRRRCFLPSCGTSIEGILACTGSLTHTNERFNCLTCGESCEP